MKTLVSCLLLALSGLAPLTAADHRPAGREYPANAPQVRYVGRTLADAGGSVSFDWTGTYLEARFTGDAFAIRVSDTGTSYYNVLLDGEPQGVATVCGRDTLISLVSGAGGGTHTLRLQKRSEGEFGRTTLHRFLLAPDGELLPAPARKARHIEFMGNSLTCGYGVEGKHADEPFEVRTENCDLAFACVTARYFDADYTLIAHSGRGAARNYGDSLSTSACTMKDKMMNTFDESPTVLWDFAKGYRPDLVVINLGSNDFSTKPHPSKEEFVKSYLRILRQLRQSYGKDMPILCLYPVGIQAPVYDYYEAVVAEAGDPHVHLLKLSPELYNRSTDLGAAWHPGISGQRKMAMCIIPHIATLMGWELEPKPVE